MINSQTLAARFHAAMPAEQTPECTQGYEGFFHLAGWRARWRRPPCTTSSATDDDCFAARKASSRAGRLPSAGRPQARITLE